MFNLIVSGGLTDSRQGSIWGSRVFKFTEDKVASRFQPNGQLDISAVMALPTILMEEGTTNEVAGVVHLYKIKLRDEVYKFHYALYEGIPLLTNADLVALALDLDIEVSSRRSWGEFNTNHWAVKDVDLFEVLYRQRNADRPTRLAPTVFQLSEAPIDPKLISIMMPFDDSFSRVYMAVKNAIEAEDYACCRADDFWMHSSIMQDIIELICTSKVVICDLSGKNPNVLYEAGIAHTLGKEVILITQHMNDVPFDLRPLRCITYLENKEGCDLLAKEVVERLRTIAPLA